MNIELEAKQWIPAAVLDEEPRSVEMIEGKDEPFLTAIKVKIGQNPSFWLLEGMGKNLSVEGSDLLLQYHRDRMNLP
ncbi:MAG: hypothetical protein EBZ47_10545, partial [Chlamydiae bacterium]|nr:hypothetical protein [Chlamydiota bacterium]